MSFPDLLIRANRLTVLGTQDANVGTTGYHMSAYANNWANYWQLQAADDCDVMKNFKVYHMQLSESFSFYDWHFFGFNSEISRYLRLKHQNPVGDSINVV